MEIKSQVSAHSKYVWRGVDSHKLKGPNSTCLRSPVNRAKLGSLTPPMSSLSLLLPGHGVSSDIGLWALMPLADRNSLTACRQVLPAKRKPPVALRFLSLERVLPMRLPCSLVGINSGTKVSLVLGRW